MALYGKKDFISDVSEIFKIDSENVTLLADKLDFKIPLTMNWSEFDERIKTIINDFFVLNNISYVLPPVVDSKLEHNNSIQDIVDSKEKFDDIISFLDLIKGKKIEDKLKSVFLNSQLEDERYNYFVNLFKCRGNMKPAQKKAFVCCYAEVLLTQKLTKKMLNWLISTFTKVCKDGINRSLDVELSGDKVNYEDFRDRSSILHLIYAITIVDSDDDMKELLERSSEILLSVLSKDSFNPKSFLDTIYFYAILNGLCYNELDNMLRKTAVLLIEKMYKIKDPNKKQGELSELEKRILINNNNSLSISVVEDILRMDERSIIKSIPLLNAFIPDITVSEAFEKAESFMEEIHVFHGDIYDRDTDTYNYYQTSIEPKMIIDSEQFLTPDEFCEYLVSERRFYENYYKVISRTRTITLFGDYRTDNLLWTAYSIVNNDLLSKRIAGYNGLNHNLWKEEILACQDDQICEIKRILNKVSDNISYYVTGCERITAVSDYFSDEVDQDELARGILYELRRPDEEKYAIEIVYRDTLSNLELKHFDRDRKWISEIQNIKDENEKYDFVSRIFEDTWNELITHRDDEGTVVHGRSSGKGIRKAKKYAASSKKSLYTAVIKEIEGPVFPESELSDEIKQYARDIVQFDSLSDLNLSSYSGTGSVRWKYRAIEIEDETERKNYIRDLLSGVLNEYKIRLDRNGNIADYSEINECINLYLNDNDVVNTDLVNAVNDEINHLQTDLGSAQDRAKYLYEVFKDYAIEQVSGTELRTTFEDSDSDESQMLVENRWSPFDTEYYTDAMLYLCLGCEDPLKMFGKIDSIPGYGYYENA